MSDHSASLLKRAGDVEVTLWLESEKQTLKVFG